MVDLSYILSKCESRISKLHPIVANKARQLITQSHTEGINIIIVQGLRTMDEQAALYAQGRTTSGAIVTNAKAGTSYHNYGLALDYALLADDGYSVLWTVNDKWRRVAEIGKSLGFVWGGDWTMQREGIVDYPHLEMAFGLSINDLLAGKRPHEQEDYMIIKSDADGIIAILGDYWKRMDGNKPVQDYAHYLANQIRKASRQLQEEEKK